MKQNKYTYYKVLQMYISGHGYDDCEFLETGSDFFLNREQRKELKNLKENYSLMGYGTRTIKRRELN